MQVTMTPEADVEGDARVFVLNGLKGAEVKVTWVRGDGWNQSQIGRIKRVTDGYVELTRTVYIRVDAITEVEYQ